MILVGPLLGGRYVALSVFALGRNVPPGTLAVQVPVVAVPVTEPFRIISPPGQVFTSAPAFTVGGVQGGVVMVTGRQFALNKAQSPLERIAARLNPTQVEGFTIAGGVEPEAL